jgi:hypothetical protein
MNQMNLMFLKNLNYPEEPLVPDEPELVTLEVPDPLEPEEPDVPLEPEEPDVPLEPEEPLVPDEPDATC